MGGWLAHFLLLQFSYRGTGMLRAIATSIPASWHTSCSLNQGAHIDCGKMPQCGKMPHFICQAHERSEPIPVSLPVLLARLNRKGCKSFTFKRIDLPRPEKPARGKAAVHTASTLYIVAMWQKCYTHSGTKCPEAGTSCPSVSVRNHYKHDFWGGQNVPQCVAWFLSG